MKVSFELRKEKINADGLIPIQFVVRAEGLRIRKNIGASTFEKHWNDSAQWAEFANDGTIAEWEQGDSAKLPVNSSGILIVSSGENAWSDKLKT